MGTGKITEGLRLRARLFQKILFLIECTNFIEGGINIKRIQLYPRKFGNILQRRKHFLKIKCFVNQKLKNILGKAPWMS